MRSSGRQIAKGTAELRERKDCKKHSVPVPAGATVRKAQSTLNQVFAPDFESQLCEDSPGDAAAMMCKDVPDFFLKVTYIRGRKATDVAAVSVNLDGGRGSQKLSAQLLYNDGPILPADPTEEAREAYAEENGGMSDISVRRTLILGLISGAKEPV